MINQKAFYRIAFSTFLAIVLVGIIINFIAHYYFQNDFYEKIGLSACIIGLVMSGVVITDIIIPTS